MTADGTCPRCGAPVPRTARWARLATLPGYQPAYRYRHQRADGRRCDCYRGPALDDALGEQVCYTEPNTTTHQSAREAPGGPQSATGAGGLSSKHPASQDATAERERRR